METSGQQSVVLRQIRAGYMYYRHGRDWWPHFGLDAGVRARVASVEPSPKRRLDLTLTGRRRQVQQAHVLDVGPLAVRSPQRVIGGPERQRREQLFPEAIPGKRARLADQATDDVAVIDPVVRRTPQPRIVHSTRPP